LCYLPDNFNNNKGLGDSYYQFNLNLSGAYFTGLSEETTLTVTSRFYVEISPPLSSSLLDLVTPPAQFDPFAINLYTRVVNMMPPGTRKGDNDAGDWFRHLGVNAAKAAQSMLTTPLVRSALSSTPLGAGVPVIDKLTKRLAQMDPNKRVLPRRKKKQVTLTPQARVNVAVANSKRRGT
jgi:hypothetical protein